MKAKGFDLTLSGLGTFARSGRATALWVGAERCEALERLAAKIETAVQRCGLEAERRRFQPHVTLARLDGLQESKAARFVAERKS